MAQFSRTTLYEAYQNRLRQVFRHLKDNPDTKHDGRCLVDLFVEEALRRSTPHDEAFFRALGRDGFIRDENGVLRRTLPEVLDLPAADDEVHVLLDRYQFTTPKGHIQGCLMKRIPPFVCISCC